MSETLPIVDPADGDTDFGDTTPIIGDPIYMSGFPYYALLVGMLVCSTVVASVIVVLRR
jgi:hypothetical protein